MRLNVWHILVKLGHDNKEYDLEEDFVEQIVEHV
jgi:hypothetical protein